MTKRIAVLGSAPSSVNLAPFDDPTWAIWATSPANRHRNLPRIDVWFEVHDGFESLGNNKQPYIAWMREQPFRIVLSEPHGAFPEAEMLPRDQIVEAFGRDDLTSSPAWMFAMARIAGADEIGIYGVDMAHHEEWGDQRSGLRNLIRRAREDGITVTIPPESDLDQPGPLYGVMSRSPMAVKMQARRRELQERMDALQAERAQIEKRSREIRDEELVLSGAIQDADYVLRTWVRE